MLHGITRRPVVAASAVSAGFCVFMLVVLTATLIAFILPKSYRSLARISLASATGTNGVANASEELLVMRSEAVLGDVIEALDLNARWSSRAGIGNRLKTAETLELLKRRLDCRVVRDTRLIEIGVLSPDPMEATDIARQVVQSYSDFIRKKPRNGLQVTVLDPPLIPRRPARPDKPLYLVGGIILGGVLGLGVATAILWIGRARN